MDEGCMFVLGLYLGSLSMLVLLLRIIIQMHDQTELNRWKR